MTTNLSAFARYRGELRELLYLAGPIMGAQMATTGMTFVDTSMAGQYSAMDLAAIALGSSIWMPVYLLIRGILMAITPTVAHLYGARQTGEIGGQVRQGLWIALLMSLLALGFIYQSDVVLQWLQVEPEMAAKTLEYLKALAWGIPAICLFQALTCYCEGMGKTKPGMVFSFIALALNIPLNYVLIYGKFGFPELGGVGCGYATAVCFWAMFLMMAGYTMLGQQHRKIGLFGHWDLPSPGIISSQLKLGVPIGLAIFFEASIFSVVALLIGKLGAIVVAGHQIALNFTSLAFMVPMSLAMGLTIRVGQALGAGNTEQAAFSSYAGIATTLVSATVSASVMLFLPGVVTSIYTQNPEVAVLAAQLLVYAALFQYADGIQIAANGALRGYKDTRVPMTMILFACWGVALPLGYILGLTDWMVEPMGPHGLWIGLVSALVMGAFLLTLRLRVIIRRNRRSDSEVVPMPA
ncbi:MATE family efflux transporter [Endozoicomonas sp. SCSIO W0465]|uniref:MATE family efflux transporter n=1 Tax=Endozoicomonas sp. SCSIO W0465 TaxID=2918516 RepID=UPI002074D325|nr:MATE family efflux transporter [Endozoicomonas sp. SCSIO W0465]USE37773.1 MATE family efflux transporter [Endozoicomonas sp. SCSIO W0465]